MQCLVAADVTVCQYLLAGGAHTAVQAQLLGAGLPHILLVLLRSGVGRLLTTAEVCVCRQQLLLFGCVWQERQQLTEDLLEALSKQVPAALVVLSRRDHPLSELPRMAFKLAEAGLIALQKVLDRLDKLQVSLPEILRN